MTIIFVVHSNKQMQIRQKIGQNGSVLFKKIIKFASPTISEPENDLIENTFNENSLV